MEFEKASIVMGIILVLLGLFLIILPNLLRLRIPREVHPLLLWKIWEKDGLVIYTSPILIVLSILFMIYLRSQGR